MPPGGPPDVVGGGRQNDKYLESLVRARGTPGPRLAVAATPFMSNPGSRDLAIHRATQAAQAPITSDFVLPQEHGIRMPVQEL